MRFSLLTLFCLNLALVLFPVISPEWDPTGANALFFNEVSAYGRLLSSVLTPLLVATTLGLGLLNTGKSRISAGLLFPALAVCLLMCLSATLADDPKVETLFMGVFFLIFTIYLAFMKTSPGGAEEIIGIFKRYFSLWLLAPIVAMVLDPSTIGMFVIASPIDVSYHGLADSRVGFGLWAPVFVVLLGWPKSKYEWLLMAVALATLLMSQSRAAMLGLALGGAYAMLRTSAGPRALIQRMLLLALLFAVPLALWSEFGRADTLTVFNEERDFILTRFFAFIDTHWLFGNGSLYLVDLPEVDKIDVPAHNLLIQTVANYGVLTLMALLVYFAGVFAVVKSTKARVLLIFLLVYSLNQPVQGTGNFFNPITLLFFLIVFAVDNVQHGASASSLAGEHIGTFRRALFARPDLGSTAK